jgi:iron complex transport system ATP-binding protein
MTQSVMAAIPLADTLARVTALDPYLCADRRGCDRAARLAAPRARSASGAGGRGGRPVIAGLSLAIERGQITALVGPNGSGKSTLLKTLARLLRPGAGAVYLDGQAISTMSTAAVARELAILPQGPSAPEALSVHELVEQGRYPHVGALHMLRQQDHAAVTAALEWTGMVAFAHRPLDSLSGGERQRAWIALALAQATPILLLDEPTTFLDIGHQLEVLDLVRQLNRERGMTIVLVLHDLNQAARYADRMVALYQGKIVADGAPQVVLTPALLEQVFAVRANIVTDSASGTPVCLPYAQFSAEPVDAATLIGLAQISLAVLVGLPCWWLIIVARRATNEHHRLTRVVSGEYSMADGAILPADLVAGAVQHMNEDHADAVLAYAQSLAGLAWAQIAELTGIDDAGVELIARAEGREETARIQFDAPLTSADELRPAMVALARQARKQR